MRQQVQACTARFKTVFPLAVHLAGHEPCGGKPYISQQYSLKIGCVGRPRGERQWKNCSEPVGWTFVLRFLQAKLYLVSHINRFGISEIVDISP